MQPPDYLQTVFVEDLPMLEGVVDGVLAFERLGRSRKKASVYAE